MQLKIGIPTNDRMYHTISNIFKESEIPLVRSERYNVGYAERWKDLKIIYIRCREIPLCLESKGIDIGITTTNMLTEHSSDLDIIFDFDFGCHKMVLAAPKGVVLADFENQVIATSYPEITRKFFENKGIKGVKILKVSGAVEAYPALELAKGIVDVCETGASLRANNLEIIEDIEHAHPVLVARKGLSEAHKKEIDFIKESLVAYTHAKTARRLVCHVPEKSEYRFLEIYKKYHENLITFKLRKTVAERFEFFCKTSKLSKLLKELYECVEEVGIEIYTPNMLFYQKKGE